MCLGLLIVLACKVARHNGPCCRLCWLLICLAAIQRQQRMPMLTIIRLKLVEEVTMVSLRTDVDIASSVGDASTGR